MKPWVLVDVSDQVDAVRSAVMVFAIGDHPFTESCRSSIHSKVLFLPKVIHLLLKLGMETGSLSDRSVSFRLALRLNKLFYILIKHF